jgi:hypothetical protein
VDLSLLATAGVALWAARKLALRERGAFKAPAARPSADANKPTDTAEVAHV